MAAHRLQCSKNFLRWFEDFQPLVSYVLVVGDDLQLDVRPHCERDVVPGGAVTLDAEPDYAPWFKAGEQVHEVPFRLVKVIVPARDVELGKVVLDDPSDGHVRPSSPGI